MSPTASKDLVDGSAAASHSGVLCPCFLGRGIVSIVSKLIGCSISSESGSGDIGAGVENRCRRLFISVLCLAAFSLLLSVFGNTSDVVRTFADVGLTLVLTISTDVRVGLVLTIGLGLVLVTAVDIGLGLVLDTSAGVGLGLVVAKSVLTLSADVGVGLVLTIGLGLVMVTAVDIGLGLVLNASAAIGLGLVVWCVAEDF